MTIKTLTGAALSSSLSTNHKSEMPIKRSGAARNLFNTTVDRDELNKQLKTVAKVNQKALNNYKADGIIQRKKIFFFSIFIFCAKKEKKKKTFLRSTIALRFFNFFIFQNCSHKT
jgi:hypothetical protein